MAELSFPRGTTYNMNVRVEENGVPKDISNGTIRLTVKEDQYDQDIDDLNAVLVKTIPGNSEGVVNIRILPEDTQLTEPMTYFYDIKVEYGSNNREIYLLDSGTMELTATPTNRID